MELNMKRIHLLLLFLVTTQALPKGSNNDHVGNKATSNLSYKITNGNEAAPHSIPFQVFITGFGEDNITWRCSGSLISPKHILTAGHCLIHANHVEVFLGLHYINGSDPNVISLLSQNFIIHEAYSYGNVNDDIGIVILNQEVILNQYINVIPLATSDNSSSYEGHNVRVSGWGITTPEGSVSAVLLEANSTIISNAACEEVYSTVKESQLCISGDNGVGICYSDFGDPLVDENQLIGIASYGTDRCGTGSPSAFTRVSSYLDWIEDNIGLTF